MSTTTSTILRVKRKIEENPQDALVLVCKRVKLDTEEISPSLFVFRGTVDNQETIGVNNIVPKAELKFRAKHDVSDIIDKMRKERKQAAQDSRYEVVNCSRNVKDIVDNEAFDLVDLQKDSGEEKDVQYTYDLYVAAKQEDFDVSMLDNLVSIENYETGLIFESNENEGQNGSEDEADDNDDSNDENNWRNEYPDTEDSSIDEEDMARAMERCDIDNDLSSSDSAEEKLYDYPPEQFNDDVKRFGSSYAKYKAKVISECTENPRNLIYCSKIRDLDEESIDGYKVNNDGFYYGEDEDTEQFREQYADVDISSDEYSPD